MKKFLNLLILLSVYTSIAIIFSSPATLNAGKDKKKESNTHKKNQQQESPSIQKLCKKFQKLDLNKQLSPKENIILQLNNVRYLMSMDQDENGAGHRLKNQLKSQAKKEVPNDQKLLHRIEKTENSKIKGEMGTVSKNLFFCDEEEDSDSCNPDSIALNRKLDFGSQERQ